MTRATPARLLAHVATVVGGGVLAGLAAMVVTLVLHAVMQLATGTLAEGFATIPPWRRVLVATCSGLGAGLAWWALRSRGPVGGIAGIRKNPSTRMSLLRNTSDALITVSAVGSGMAVGRETAPRQIAAAATDHLAVGLRLPTEHRIRAVCAAAAAGLAAVYNAPLAGIAYAAEVVVGRWSWALVATATVTCAIGTWLAHPVVGAHPNMGWFTGLDCPWWLGLPVGIVAAGVGPLYRRATDYGRTAVAPRAWRLVLGLGGVGLALGLLTIALPELTGNGRATFGVVLRGHPTLVALGVLMLLRPLLTSAFLRAGAVGGVLAPALATGACAGALVAHAVGRPELVPALGVVGAGATLSLTQRAPLFGALLAWEMTHPGLSTTLALAAATAVAQTLVRLPLVLRGRRIVPGISAGRRFTG